MARKFVLISALFLLGACVGPAPIKEYNIANTALQSARGAKAPSYAPGYWSRAQKSYFLAEKLYSEGKFEEAKAAFLKAKLFAERAENYTVLKVMKDGGDL